MKRSLSLRHRFKGLCLVLGIGIIICVWQIGRTGLIDETPPLFAAASRAMSSTGDWLTPRVNGIPRFDKPPLIYWLMGFVYALPGNAFWDPLGTWAARLPSALSTVLAMCFLADTSMRWPKEEDPYPRRTALVVALSFALSPLVIIWSRISVSDALLCSTLGISLLSFWRQYVKPSAIIWWTSWIFLGLAVLTKGPIAIVLSTITLVFFGLHQGDIRNLIIKLKPIPGLIITVLISLPWYLIELFIEGKQFWDSFFGYHNFQRFTSVVNSHLQPWWFFAIVLVIASLPFTPLLFLGLWRAFFPKSIEVIPVKESLEDSIDSFAGCWLLAVFIFFTCAATKLPSYWLPATPAAALLIGSASIDAKEFSIFSYLAWIGSILIAFLLSLVLWISPYWIPFINDPEMPNLSAELISSKLALRGAFLLFICALVGLYFLFKKSSLRLLLMQLALIFSHLFVLLPVWSLADKLRQLPIRQAAKIMVESQKTNEPMAMVGIIKPSLHFYTNKIIIYEEIPPSSLVNLAQRLSFEKRKGWEGRPLSDISKSDTLLVLIDNETIKRPNWVDLEYEIIGKFGIYKLLRINRFNLQNRADKLIKLGVEPDWELFRPERL